MDSDAGLVLGSEPFFYFLVGLTYHLLDIEGLN